MKEIKVYYAVDRSGQGRVFATLPTRDSHINMWVGDVNIAVLRFVCCLETDYSFTLPDITWEDEPVELKISVSYDT